MFTKILFIFDEKNQGRNSSPCLLTITGISFTIEPEKHRTKVRPMGDEINMDMDLVTVVDDDGKEHLFEELDRIETDSGDRYVALIPVLDDDIEILEDDGDVLILKVLEEDGESYLVQIEDEDEFNEIGNIFEDRLIEKYESDSES